jgi:hypothetical protein
MNKKITISFAIILSFTSIKIFSQGLTRRIGGIQLDYVHVANSVLSLAAYKILEEFEKDVKKAINTYGKEYGNRLYRKIPNPLTAPLTHSIENEYSTLSDRLNSLELDMNSLLNPTNAVLKSKNQIKIDNLRTQLIMLRSTFVSRVRTMRIVYTSGELSNLYQNFLIYAKHFNKQLDEVDKSINKYRLQAGYILR